MKHHAMKAYGGVEVQLHAFLTLALCGIQWSALHPSHFTTRETATEHIFNGAFINYSKLKLLYNSFQLITISKRNLINNEGINTYILF
jgi:hypothetical protein